MPTEENQTEEQSRPRRQTVDRFLRNIAGLERNGLVSSTTTASIDETYRENNPYVVPNIQEQTREETVDGNSEREIREGEPRERHPTEFEFPDTRPEILKPTPLGIPHRIYAHAKNSSQVKEYLEDWRDRYFFKNPSPLTIGMEVELYIVDSRGRLLQNYDIVERITESLPEYIWRDYYAYQLEIRTRPYDNPKSLMRNFNGLFKKAEQACYENGFYLVPTAYIEGYVPCGIHIHVRYKQKQQRAFERAWNAYPFMLQIASFFKNSPGGAFLGNRMVNSRHIGLAPRSKKLFLSGMKKYRDWHFNKTRRRHSDHPRHRLKDVDTLECRFYDTVSLDRLSNLILAHFNLMSYIKPETLGEKIEDTYFAEVALTRENMLANHQPFNIALNLISEEFDFLFSKTFKMNKLYHPPRYENYGSLYRNDIVNHMINNVIAMAGKKYRKLMPADVWLRDCEWVRQRLPPSMLMVRIDGMSTVDCNCNTCVNSRRAKIENYINEGRLRPPRSR